MNRNYSGIAGPDLVGQLLAAGCLDTAGPALGLPKSKARSFYATEPDDYAQSRVFALSPNKSGYLVTLRLGTYRAGGTVIADWSFVAPWEEHIIDWDYKPSDVFRPNRSIITTAF